MAAFDGTNGFTINGIDIGDVNGRAVSGAGDVNADGFDDVIVGSSDADPNSDGRAGESYVVFGKAGGFAASLDLVDLDGTNGFRIDGIDANDQSGRSVRGAGDVNGDGFDDVIIGARNADAAGESYVVFGCNFTGAVTHLGDAGDDNLTGTAGDDNMVGAQGNDTIDGAAGNDRLAGATGDDVLTGGADDDLFVFGDGGGGDTVTDFVAGAGTDDVIDVSGVGGIGDFADVQAAASLVGADTVIDFGGGDTITILGVDPGDLHADDFLT